MTPFRPRAISAGFVHTPIGLDPATTLISPRQLSELGAAGGSMVELSLPPPLNDHEGEAVDRLYQETMDYRD